MRLQSIAFATTLLVAASAQASGFLLMNHGARSTGRGNATVAAPKDGSAIYHNPAGISLLGGYQVYLGANAIGPSQKFTGDDGATAEQQSTFIVSPHAYFTGEINDMITVGLGVNPPYGSGQEWDENSPGRQIVREINLRTWFITPTVAVKNFGVDGLSFGAGLDLAPASAYLKQDVLFGDSVGTAELSGTAFGIGGRFGLHYNPSALRQLHIGLSYRLPVSYTFEGEGDFDAEPQYRDQLPLDGDGKVELEVPQWAALGIAYDILPELQVEVDVNYVGWSSYDALRLTLPPNAGDTAPQETVLPRNWDDTIVVRAGVEYDSKDFWAVRAGYVYDPTPVPAETLDFTLADIDRNIVTAGASFELPANIVVDAAFWYLIPGSNETSREDPFSPPIKGTFDVSAYTASLSARITFGEPKAPVQGSATETQEMDGDTGVVAPEPGSEGVPADAEPSDEVGEG